MLHHFSTVAWIGYYAELYKVIVEHLSAILTDLVFADDTVIFAVSLVVFEVTLEILHKEVKSFALEIPWLKIKVQVFGGLLDETVKSVYESGEDIEVLENFTYIDNIVCNDGGSNQEVVWRIVLAHGVMDSLNTSIWRCRYLYR